MNERVMDTLVNGIDDTLASAAKQRLEQSIRAVSKNLDDAKNNRTTKQLFGNSQSTTQDGLYKNGATDSQLYTNIAAMINGSPNNTVTSEFGVLLDSLYMKNKKYYTIIKDYEIMPILIPQINRVLMFLVNECLSPDIQNTQTFLIKYTGSGDEASRIQSDIDSIKKEMKLDNQLREVYMNRYRLGKEYYAVIDYNRTFTHMLEMIERKQMNEDTSQLNDMDYLSSLYSTLNESIDSLQTDIVLQVHTDNTDKPGHTNTRDDKTTYIEESTVHLSFDHLNIILEKSSLAGNVENAHAELLQEAYSSLTSDSLISKFTCTGTLNEAVVDTSKLEVMVAEIRKKSLQRCTIERMDPARIFQLKVGGKIIGYFYVRDINENALTTINFAQSLKDQLLKSRATNIATATQSAEEVVSRALAERIINTFDPNIGINRIEDIDLLHDYVLNNEIYRGNKRITFYYADEIYDMSRTDGSILTNAVFFTKLYSTLLLNNIITKVLRGRGRQIHTVRLGASTGVQRYIQNAMATLSMPENNLGAMHGPFREILVPFNSASDIIIPTEDDNQKYIETDYIPGQDINMDDDFLRMLLNAIVSSFGLDAAIIDATNGNLQFAKTLSMESLQICNSIHNEQQDLIDAWERMCLKVLYIMGDKTTRTAIDDGKIKVEFFEPKSLILQNTIDEINNAKSYMESIADIIPEFNEDGAEAKRAKFIYNGVKERTNIDWSVYDKILEEINIEAVSDDLMAEARRLRREYSENIKEEQYGDHDDNGIVDANDQHEAMYGDYTPDEGGEDLTQEEEDLLNTPSEEEEEEL